MAKIINISNKLNNEPSFLILSEDKKYKINDDCKAVMQAMELFQGDVAPEAMLKAIEILLGKKAKAEIEQMSINNVKTVFMALLAVIGDEDFETVEARFHDEEGSQK